MNMGMKTRSMLMVACWLITAAASGGMVAVLAQDATHDLRFTLAMADIMEDVAGSADPFPKYTTQLLNLANQNSQATRPNQVGQMSELIQEFPGRGYGEWVKWYTGKHPGAIDQASEKTYEMVEKMRTAMAGIDRAMTRRWISELVLTKTYAGLRFQESVLKKIAAMKNTTYRLATPEEETKGIDGFIGLTPVSVKPTSYASKPFLNETIPVDIIYYEKIRGGIRVTYSRQK